MRWYSLTSTDLNLRGAFCEEVFGIEDSKLSSRDLTFRHDFSDDFDMLFEIASRETIDCEKEVLCSLEFVIFCVIVVFVVAGCSNFFGRLYGNDDVRV